MDSNQSYVITGLGGSGKTTLLKQIQKRPDKQELIYTTLRPTNLAALLVGGENINNFSANLRISSCVKI